MSSRALSLATVLFLIGFGAADTVLAQATNLEAGKTPSQLFSQTCTACHKSPRGLLKSVPPGSLPGYLRQHYTTSSDMAGILASYLVSNGATDTRYQAKDGKKDGAREKDAGTEHHQGRRPRAQDAARPEGEAGPAVEGGRQKRAARPAEDGAKPDGEAAPEGRKGKRRAKPVTEDASKADAATPANENKKSEPKPETAKPESPKPDSESGKASEKPAEPKPDSSAKVEPRSSDAPTLRPDPVPQVTPAAPAAAKPAEPPAAKPVEEAAPKPAASAEPAPAPKPQDKTPSSSGPPAPPISR